MLVSIQTRIIYKAQVSQQLRDSNKLQPQDGSNVQDAAGRS